MQLPDGPRHIVAGLIASLVFLLLFSGVRLVWWLALILALAAYGAALLIIARRSPAEEIAVAERVSQADIDRAAALLGDAAARLTDAAEAAPERDKLAFHDMAMNMLSIRSSILDDPRDYRPTRRFTAVYLPKILDSVEGYVRIASGSHAVEPARLDAIAARIRGFQPIIAGIDRACIENDLRELEVQVDVLAGQMERG